MDIVTLGAALNGSAEYVKSHFKGGANISIVDNLDGTQTINASGEVSSEDTVARAEIADIKDGTSIDSFSGVEAALGNKQDTISDLSAIRSGATLGGTAVQGVKVNNATVTPDTNKVINITVPTTASDVDALPDTTKYAASLSLSINSSTFVVTGQLKDQDGNNLGTAQTIDLPLESVVVNGSYNSQTKKVVLTLQNGNTIEFSVADLVAGLQTELSSSNKLNPAYINYDSTHRAVTDTEKSTWNNAATTVTTNTAALIELVNEGAKNVLKITESSGTSSGVTFTVNADGTITTSGTVSGTSAVYTVSSITLKKGTYRFSNEGGEVQNRRDAYIQVDNAGTWETVARDYENQTFTLTSDSLIRVRERVYSGYESGTFKPMICTKAEWDISQEYEPHALPNPQLTAATIEMVDSGAKNKLNHTAYTRTVNGVTYTVNADRSITITSDGTNTQSLLYLVQNYTGVPAGNYVLSGCSGGSSTTYDLRVKVGSTTYINYEGGTEFYYNGTDAFESTIVVRASQTVNITMKPMVCSKADWDISQSYQPYRPSYQELSDKVDTVDKRTGIGIVIPDYTDVNSITTEGEFIVTTGASAETMTNLPSEASSWAGHLTVKGLNSTSNNRLTHTYMPTWNSSEKVGIFYTRHLIGTNQWTSWYKFEGTAVT